MSWCVQTFDWYSVKSHSHINNIYHLADAYIQSDCHVCTHFFEHTGGPGNQTHYPVVASAMLYQLSQTLNLNRCCSGPLTNNLAMREFCDQGCDSQ